MVFFLALGVGLGPFSPGTASGDDRWPEVTIDPKDQSCDSPKDCVVVFNLCNSCSCGVTVNRIHLKKYESAYETLCRDYKGPHCDKVCAPYRNVCRGSRCEMIPWDDESGEKNRGAGL
jgi:hypothetical protein